MIPRCPQSRKIQYPTEQIANNALDEMIAHASSRRDRHAIPSGVFQCQQCGKWHHKFDTAPLSGRSRRNRGR